MRGKKCSVAVRASSGDLCADNVRDDRVRDLGKGATQLQAKLVLDEMEEPILNRSIEEARRAGYLQNRKIRVALDTTPMLGKGAVKDTYNLLGQGIETLARRLAEVEEKEVTVWAEQQGLSRYLGNSLKGEVAIDWDEKAQREQWLSEIVEDGGAC